MSDDFNENPITECPKCKRLGAEVIFDMDTWSCSYPGKGTVELRAVMPLWRCTKRDCSHVWDHPDFSDYIRERVESDWIEGKEK